MNIDMSESRLKNKNQAVAYEAQSDEKDNEMGLSDLSLLTKAVDMLRKGGLFGLQAIWSGRLPQVIKGNLKYLSILDKPTRKQL